MSLADAARACLDRQVVRLGRRDSDPPPFRPVEQHQPGEIPGALPIVNNLARRRCRACDVGWFGVPVCWACGRPDDVELIIAVL